RAPYHDRFALDRIERALQAQTQSRADQPRLPRAEHAENMLFAAQANSKALRRVTPYIPGSLPKERLSQQADIALASFKAGVCVSANLSIGQFDSHANNDNDQMKLIPEFLAGIRYLFRRAEDLRIRDRPEHIHGALRDLAGIADHPFSRKFPLGVADKERLRGLWG